MTHSIPLNRTATAVFCAFGMHRSSIQRIKKKTREGPCLRAFAQLDNRSAIVRGAARLLQRLIKDMRQANARLLQLQVDDRLDRGDVRVRQNRILVFHF